MLLLSIFLIINGKVKTSPIIKVVSIMDEHETSPAVNKERTFSVNEADALAVLFLVRTLFHELETFNTRAKGYLAMRKQLIDHLHKMTIEDSDTAPLKKFCNETSSTFIKLIKDATSIKISYQYHVHLLTSTLTGSKNMGGEIIKKYRKLYLTDIEKSSLQGLIDQDVRLLLNHSSHATLCGYYFPTFERDRIELRRLQGELMTLSDKMVERYTNVCVVVAE